MSLAEALAAKQRRVGCRVYDILTSLNNEDREALTSALGGTTWSNQALASLLKAEGYPVGKTTIGLHRNGACICYESYGKTGGTA